MAGFQRCRWFAFRHMDRHAGHIEHAQRMPTLQRTAYRVREFVSVELPAARFFARRASRRTCLALCARRLSLISRTLLTGSDNATRRSEPLCVQRLHQRGSSAVVLADLRDERREIGAATASFIEFGHRRQCRGDAGIEPGVGVPQILLELRPVQVGGIDRPSLGASVGQFPPRPAGAVPFGGLPRGIDITLAQARAVPTPRLRRSGQRPPVVARGRRPSCVRYRRGRRRPRNRAGRGRSPPTAAG